MLLLGGLLTVLLCLDLGGRALWTDEGFSLAAGRPLRQALFTDASHPPGYQLLLHYWLQHAQSDAWLRAFSVPWALLTWWLGWLVAARLGLRREGLLGALLMAISPLVLTYFRLGRYYAMAAALTMLCLYLLVRLAQALVPAAAAAGEGAEGGGPRSAGRAAAPLAVALAVSLAAVGYTDYTAIVICSLAGAVLALALAARREWRAVLVLLAVGAGAALLLAPLALLALQSARTVAAIGADALAHSPWGLLLKLALPVFSLATGECVDAWRWAFTVPALTATVVLLLAGLAALWRRPVVGPMLALAWPLTIVVATAMMSTVAANIPPNRVTSFAVFTIPLAYLLLACGLQSFRSRAVRLVLLLPLLVTYAYGIGNYLRGEQLLNQGFAAPWREAAAIIRQHERLDDVVVSAEEIFARYYRGQAAIGQEPLLREYLAGTPVPAGRVWLVTRDRGSQELAGLGMSVREKLLGEGWREQVFNLLPRTPQEQRMMSLVLRRPAWDAYVKIYLLQPPVRR